MSVGPDIGVGVGVCVNVGDAVLVELGDGVGLGVVVTVSVGEGVGDSVGTAVSVGVYVCGDTIVPLVVGEGTPACCLLYTKTRTRLSTYWP